MPPGKMTEATRPKRRFDSFAVVAFFAFRVVIHAGQNRGGTADPVREVDSSDFSALGVNPGEEKTNATLLKWHRRPIVSRPSVGVPPER